jgi:hypothetical protein
MMLGTFNLTPGISCPLWDRIRSEAMAMSQEEPILQRYYKSTILQVGMLQEEMQGIYF